MSLRLPHPMKAVASLWQTYTDPLMLYRLQYETDAGDIGTVAWLDRQDAEPQLFLNTHNIYVPKGETYAVKGYLTTEVRGEEIPICVLQRYDGETDSETVSTPERFQGRTLPEIDRRDEYA